jgi:hypothetical protein
MSEGELQGATFLIIDNRETLRAMKVPYVGHHDIIVTIT